MCSQNESEVNIKNVSQFIEYLESHEYLNREFLFRGHSKTSYKIEPSINRNDNLKKERDYIEIPQLKFPGKFNPSQSPITQLALLQHYGFPTRLLDVTTNPLVALYFAVRSLNKDENGEIIVFNYLKHNLLLDEINALAQSYKFGFDFENKEDESYYYLDFYNNFCQKTEKINRKESNKKRVFNSISVPFFIDAPYLTARQQAQGGKYIFFPYDLKGIYTSEETKHFEKPDPTNSHFFPTITPISKDDNNFVKDRIKIDKESKNKIRDDLDILGFNKMTLFPEDFDGSCRKIKADIEKY